MPPRIFFGIERGERSQLPAVAYAFAKLSRLLAQKFRELAVTSEMDHHLHNGRNVCLRSRAVQLQGKECLQRSLVATRRGPSDFVVIHALPARLRINFVA